MLGDELVDVDWCVFVCVYEDVYVVVDLIDWFVFECVVVWFGLLVVCVLCVDVVVFVVVCVVFV